MLKSTRRSEVEHRHNKRDLVGLKVQLRFRGGMVLHGVIKDLSATGAGIVVTSGTPAKGSIVEVKLPAVRGTSSSQRPQVRGYVVWAQANEFGLAWITEDESLPHFSNTIFHVADPAAEFLDN